jgi:penicillin-binding protein 1A
VRLEKSGPDSSWTTSLEQEPNVQGSIMSMNPKTGEVFCMVGGRDLEQSQFNRVTQAVRQPGSAFKPILYAAALDKDFTPASVLVDSAVVYEDGANGLWKPANYDDKFWGYLSLRKALVHSRNVVSVKLLEEIGPEYVIDYARRLGVQAQLTPTLSLALGASGISLWEMMTAYSTFAHEGQRTTPYLIRKIVDRNGNILEEHQVQSESVISPQTAFVMTDILTSVIERGTGRRAKKLGRPAAGKTGTTNDFRDAWFIGYTPSVLTGVWVGHDNDSISLGKKEAGGRVACPIWLYYMQHWLQDQPVEEFTAPPGVVFSKMNENTGAVDQSDGPNVVYAAFVEGKIQDSRRRAVVRKKPASSSVSFFKSDIF